MEECLFCKIVDGKIPSVKIWEDEKHIAILDLFPNMEGVTLVITKKHFDSYAFELPDKEYTALMLATKKVAKMLDKGLKTQRSIMVMEGLGVNHIHIKLYPVHGLDNKFDETWAEEKVYFESYPGYISTKMGPQKTAEELKKLADKIAKNNK